MTLGIVVSYLHRTTCFKSLLVVYTLLENRFKTPCLEHLNLFIKLVKLVSRPVYLAMEYELTFLHLLLLVIFRYKTGVLDISEF